MQSFNFLSSHQEMIPAIGFLLLSFNPILIKLRYDQTKKKRLKCSSPAANESLDLDLDLDLDEEECIHFHRIAFSSKLDARTCSEAHKIDAEPIEPAMT